jgi:hypothetical protein
MLPVWEIREITYAKKTPMISGGFGSGLLLQMGHHLNNLWQQLVLTTRHETRPHNLVFKTLPSKLSVVDVSSPIELVSQLPPKSETPEQHFKIQHAHRFPEAPQVITWKGHNKHWRHIPFIFPTRNKIRRRELNPGLPRDRRKC